MRALPVLTVLLASAPALAEERKMAVSMGAGMVASDDNNDALLNTRLALSWERPRIAMPDSPGYKLDGTLVPELIGGTQHLEDRIEALIGAGVRAELRMAQREMGLLKVSARAGFYAAVRAAVVGKSRDPQIEFLVGEYFYLGKHSGTRLGFEGGYVRRDVDQMPEGGYVYRPDQGVFAQVYLSFGM